MGFLSKIVGGVTKAIGGGGIGDMFKKALGGLMDPFKKVMDGVLGKAGGLLSGLMSKVTGFLGKLGPLASMASGPLGMIGGLLQNIPVLGKLADFAKNLMGAFGGPGALPAMGAANMTEMIAQRHAQLIGNLLR